MISSRGSPGPPWSAALAQRLVARGQAVGGGGNSVGKLLGLILAVDVQAVVGIAQ